MLLIEEQSNLLLTGRGCTAIALVLRHIDKVGAQILIPANICEVVVATIRNEGYKPVYADVDPLLGNAEKEHFEAAMTNQVVAVIAIPNFGSPINMPAIRSWCDEQSIFLIEDLCNALGSTFEGEPLGEFGDAVIYSFGYAKIFEHGIGGALKVRDNMVYDSIKKKLNKLPEHSNAIVKADRDANAALRKVRSADLTYHTSAYIDLYDRYAPSLVFKLTEQQENDLIKAYEAHDLQANINHRMAIADIYRRINRKGLRHKPLFSGEVVWRYCLLADSKIVRDEIVRKLRKNDIIVSTWYPNVAALFEPDYKTGSLPGAEEFGGRVINLFVDHRIDEERALNTVYFIEKELRIDSN